ncbi:MAG: biotin--[acetyl-CoA-carboxylase] ligase [Bacteroidales bacterium]|nr:biotin--[acetyl-CoA-carboxylase] ligase [Bacteroidales bacterium]
MIGKRIFEITRIDSTNTYAQQIDAKQPLEDGTVIWAREQYAGRGQQDHVWQSEPGKNLTFTVVLKPHFLEPQCQFLLNKAISLGILDFIQASISPECNPRLVPGNQTANLKCKIKWPNDILYGDLKMAGILIETKVMGLVFDTAFIGIGININQTHFVHNLPNAISLIQVMRREIGLKEALVKVCQYMDLRYMSLKNLKIEQLNDDYHHHLLGVEEWRDYTREKKTIKGMITGVDDFGRLMVKHPQGDTISYHHKEIEYIL